MIMEGQHSDQWLLDGDCKLCRRAKYCKKKCTPAKRRGNAAIAEAINKTQFGKTMGTIMGAMEKSREGNFYL